MLTLLIGPDWVANRDEILSRISDDVAQKNSGRVLLVPELISHDIERRLCASAGDTACRFAEVLSFSRLSRRVSDYVGHSAKECLDAGGRLVAMACTARQLHSRLKAYAAVETKPEFLTSLVEAIDEFKASCVSSQMLLNAASHTDGALAQKLEELSLIMQTYDSICAQGKRDPRDEMNWLLEELYDCDYASEHVFYIDGFPDFTRQHTAILEHFIRHSEHVVISLNCDKPGSKDLAMERAGTTASELVQIAKRWGIPVQTVPVSPRETAVSSIKQYVFQGELSEAGCNQSLKVFQAATVYEECTLAAQRILELVQSGARYRDISVVCADMTQYKNPVGSVLGRCGIPVYISGTEQILDKSLITTVLSALDAALSGFDQRCMLRYLKSALSVLDMDTCDRVENYILLWSVSGKKFVSPWGNHPRGLSEEWTESDKQDIGFLEAARVGFMKPLLKLKNSFDNAKCLKEQVLALYAFMEEIELAQRLQTLSDQMDAKGDNRNAQILNQLWEILLGALEQLHDTLGEMAWDSDTFTRLLRLLLSQYDVGTIPPVLDSVTAGPASALRCQQSKHLIILGALEGSFPGYSGMIGVLSDQERQALLKVGLQLSRNAMDELQVRFYEIYAVLCGAEKSLWVSCPDGRPSFVYKRLWEMASDRKKADVCLGPVLTDPMEASAYLVRWEARKAAAKLGLAQDYELVLAKRNHSLGAVNAQNITGLYGNTLMLSASQIDKLADCRFSYFLKYGLRAKERKPVAVDPTEFGTFVHAVLEQTGRAVMDRGGFHQVTMEQTLELSNGFAAEYIREHFSQLDSDRLNYLLTRNGQELEMVVRELWQELSLSQFIPTAFELPFGEGQDMDAVTIHAQRMSAQLRGFVDRVDLYDDGHCKYFRVVDYKTGKKDFDYCDIFNGLGLQLLLYLFTLEDNGDQLVGHKRIPAGVLYFPARAPYLSAEGMLSDEEAGKERRTEWKRRGLILADKDVIDAMEPENGPDRLSIRRKKDGSISGDLADRAQLQLLKKYVFTFLGEMVDDVAAGNVEPNPYTRGSKHNACRFCPYGIICGAEIPGRRDYKEIKADRFWADVQREVTGRG